MAGYADALTQAPGGDPHLFANHHPGWNREEATVDGLTVGEVEGREREGERQCRRLPHLKQPPRRRHIQTVAAGVRRSRHASFKQKACAVRATWLCTTTSFPEPLCASPTSVLSKVPTGAGERELAATPAKKRRIKRMELGQITARDRRPGHGPGKWRRSKGQEVLRRSRSSNSPSLTSQERSQVPAWRLIPQF
jgi:hypothetical protein